MKKIWLAACFAALAALFTACSSNPEVSSVIYRYPASSTVQSSPKKYHLKLHDSDLPLPAKETCMAAQKRAFSGMSDEDVQLLQKTVREWHYYLEGDFVDGMRERLSDPEAPGWGRWEQSGTIKRGVGSIKEGYDTEEFLERVGEEMVKASSPELEQWEREGIVTFAPLVYEDTGPAMIEQIQKAADGVKDESLLADLKTIQETMQSAVEHHRIEDLDTVHRLLHDCDYWLVNYPVKTLAIAPPDWDGINVYFDCLESLRT